MRLLLKLKAEKSDEFSLNYNYALSSAIYQLLKFGSSEFTSFLHDVGYVSNSRTYKLFTFCLKFDSAELNNWKLKLISPYASLYVSSPMIEEFIKNFVIGTFSSKKIEVYSEYIRSNFLIEQAEFIPEPEYLTSMNFKMLAPLVISKQRPINGRTLPYYFRIEDDLEELNRILQQNLINKYSAIYNRPYHGKGIRLEWNKEYSEKAAKSGKRLSKKVSILKELDNPIDIVGIFCPFKIEGDVELIKVGYESGFGEKNSMGFGMVYTDR